NADVTALSEVVVIGYGEQKKEDLTGAVVALGSKDFNRGVISSPQDLIVGKMAGVAVTASGGAPGSGSQIRIRGGSSMSASNDPLIVVDGFPLDNANISGSSNGLATVNPNDIASVTVLKDASATAIYGSRASNGVIIITTKKGAEGKPQVGYNGTVSVATPARYIDVMSGDEYRTLLTDLAAAGTVSGLDTDALSRLGGASTDWQKKSTAQRCLTITT
ncbi:MAG: TonB-dependent receptor plug domain-containing protein, partial [Bacteroidia bacterium]|nr:TonB-dependent receptor plug domain-containing protein [Bacteroidia bacterium]